MPAPPLPVLVAHKCLDVQIHRHVFGGSEWNLNVAWEILEARVDHMTLAFKYPFSKDQHCSDDCVLKKKGGGGEKTLLICGFFWAQFPKVGQEERKREGWVHGRFDDTAAIIWSNKVCYMETINASE